MRETNIRIKCDRCRNYIIVPNNEPLPAKDWDYVSHLRDEDRETISYDLCPRCHNAFKHFLKGYKVYGEDR